MNGMGFGPKTTVVVASLNEKACFEDARSWNAECYSVPFSERLIGFISDYFFIPQEKDRKLKSVRALVEEGQKKTGVSFSRTTLDAWLKGERDPSLNSGEQKTRDNMLRLAAILGLDCELISELAGKVFFTRPFDFKNRMELLCAWYALHDDGTENWYIKAENQMERIVPAEKSVHISDTKVLVNAVEAFSEKQLIEMISSSESTFDENNRCMAAKKLTAEYAGRIWNRHSPGTDIQYDTLIDGIIGYTQRNQGGAIGAVTGMGLIPAQISCNFPSGAVLRKIMLNEENSSDKIIKMLKLLLFDYYFETDTIQKQESRFNAFLMFADFILDQAGFPELYPRQPFDGLLLFCATHPDPLAALREYIAGKANEELENVLTGKLKNSFPRMTESSIKSFITVTGYDSFLTDLVSSVATACKLPKLPDTVTEYLTGAGFDGNDDQGWQDTAGGKWMALQIISDAADFSEIEKKVLCCSCLFPDRKLSDEIFSLLMEKEAVLAAGELRSKGFLGYENGVWSVDYRIRQMVFDQEWEPTWNSSQWAVKKIREASSEMKTKYSKNRKKEIFGIMNRLLSLDGADEIGKAGLEDIARMAGL